MNLKEARKVVERGEKADRELEEARQVIWETEQRESARAALADRVGRMPVVELGGVYDDTASTSPDALFANRVPEGPAGATRSLKFTWGESKTTEVETVLVGYRRSVDKQGLTKWTARLQPTGSVTES